MSLQFMVCSLPYDRLDGYIEYRGSGLDIIPLWRQLLLFGALFDAPVSPEASPGILWPED